MILKGGVNFAGNTRKNNKYEGESPWEDGIDALWREGVALQLLAVGLKAEDLQTDHVRTLRAGQRERLERRDYLTTEHQVSLSSFALLKSGMPTA